MTLHDSFISHETSSVNKSVTTISDSPPQKPIIKRPFGNPKSNEFITISSDDSDSDDDFPSISGIFRAKKHPIVKNESISRTATSHTTSTTATSSASLSSIIGDSRGKHPIPKSKHIIKKERYILLRYY
jgi:hypothetical protein